MRRLEQIPSLILVSLVLPCYAQTTQGLISGRLVNLRTAKPIPGATLFYSSLATSASGTSQTDRAG